MKQLIKVLFILWFALPAYAQVAYECTIEQNINGNSLEISVFIKSIGSTSFKIGGANFRMNVDTSALDITTAPIELAEGLWDNDFDPNNYGDQGVGFNLAQGWVSVDIYGEGTGDGVVVPATETLVGTIGIPIKEINDTSGIKWRLGVLNSTEIVDVNLNDITSSGTFIDPPKIILTGLGATTIPTEFKLFQNYPNPFNPATTIKFALPEATSVSIKIYNSLGELVTGVVNKYYDAGHHKVQINANEYKSGVYFYRIITKNHTDIKKMVLIK